MRKILKHIPNETAKDKGELGQLAHLIYSALDFLQYVWGLQKTHLMGLNKDMLLGVLLVHG